MCVIPLSRGYKRKGNKLMYISTYDMGNPCEMNYVERKFIHFDIDPHAIHIDRYDQCLVIRSDAINSFFSKSPYYRIPRSLVRLFLDYESYCDCGTLMICYRRYTFGMPETDPYAFHKAYCTPEELEILIKKLWSKDCKDPAWLREELTCFPCAIYREGLTP